VSAAVINDQGGAIVKCQPVYTSSAGKVKLARANAAGTARPLALVFDASIANGDTGNVQSDGVFTATTAQWDAQTGDVGGLVAKDLYWVSDVAAGKLLHGASLPSGTGSFDSLLGEAIDTERLRMRDPLPIGPLP
jgi:hypothetical protein